MMTEKRLRKVTEDKLRRTRRTALATISAQEPSIENATRDGSIEIPAPRVRAIVKKAAVTTEHHCAHCCPQSTCQCPLSKPRVTPLDAFRGVTP